MKKYSGGFLRIAFFIIRLTKIMREWFHGTMLYTRHNTKWFVRVFELGNGVTEALLDFGSLRPDGIIACGVPARFLKKFFAERGMGDVPIMAFPQNPYPGVGCATFDFAEVARRAINLFRRRGCRHAVYVGAHLRNGIRVSRSFARAFAAEAERAGLTYSIPPRKVYSSVGIRVSECDEVLRQLAAFPKPCGILTYDDGIGRDLLDLCRLAKIDVPGSVYMLGMDDNELICQHSHPSLSSVEFDYERTAFLAAAALDDMIRGRTREPPRLVCGVKGITERATTQDSKNTGNIVSRACDYIRKNACREGGIDQRDIAKHLGVSVRTVQLRFKEAKFPRTILQEVQRVQFEKLCRLLTTTDDSISGIIAACGFGSLSRAKISFRKRFGMSMRDYCKREKGK